MAIALIWPSQRWNSNLRSGARDVIGIMYYKYRVGMCLFSVDNGGLPTLCSFSGNTGSFRIKGHICFFSQGFIFYHIMVEQIPKESILNAILLGLRDRRQSTLVAHLQHLLQVAAILAEAHLGSVTSTFHDCAARGDRDPSHRLFHGPLEVSDHLGSAFLDLRLQVTPQKEVRWGQIRRVRGPLDAHSLGNQTVLEVLPKPRPGL